MVGLVKSNGPEIFGSSVLYPPTPACKVVISSILNVVDYGRTGRSVPHSHEFLNQREIELRTHRFHRRDRPIKAQMDVSAPKAANQFEFLTPPLSCLVPATVSESDFGPARGRPPSITQPIAEVHGHSRCRAGNPLWFRNSRKSGAGGN